VPIGLRPGAISEFDLKRHGGWGRSTQDLVQTLDDLHGWKVNVLVSAPQAVRSCAPSWPDWPSSSAI
jgi:hypothetical protein